jgi:hypothetical protein
MARLTPAQCLQSGGTSEPDADGDRHTHVCTEDKGHGPDHKCEYCPYTWQEKTMSNDEEDGRW